MTNPVRTLDVCGHQVTVDDALGKLCVAHDGFMRWDKLQDIKTAIWGPDARAIEVYPRAADVVNNGNYRHLWLLGSADFAPNLLHYDAPSLNRPFDRLEERCIRLWAAADGVFA